MGKTRIENKKINKKSNINKVQKKRNKMNGKEIKKPKIVETNNKKVTPEITNSSTSKRKINKSKEVQNIKRKISSPYTGKTKRKKLRKELKLLMAEAEIPVENIKNNPVTNKRKKPIEITPSPKKKTKTEEPNSPGRYVRVKNTKEESLENSENSSESGSESYIDKFFSDTEYETAENGESSSSEDSDCLSDGEVEEMFKDIFHSADDHEEEEEEEVEDENDDKIRNILSMIKNVKDMENSDSEYSFDAENDVAEEISSNDDTYDTDCDDSDDFNPILRNSFEEIDSFSDESMDEEEDEDGFDWDDDDDDDEFSDHEIHRRSPRVFDCDDNSNSFNSEDDDEPRIVEVSEAQAAQIIAKQNSNDLSDDSCPELVPIEENYSKCPIELGKTAEKNEDDDEVHLIDMIFSSTQQPETKKSKSQSFQPKPIMEEIKNIKFYPGVNSQVLVLLKDRIYLHGAVKIRLLAGNVEILGYKLKSNETKEIYSPRGHSLLSIETKPKMVLEKLNLDEFKDDFVNFELEEIQQNFDKNSSLFLLENLPSNKQVEMIGACMKEAVFPNLKTNNVERSFHKAEFILNCLFYSDPAKAFKVNPEWNKIEMKSESKLVLIGGKSVGKSTLLRFLINKNLEEHKKILLIDLDIGQAEIFVPFTLSATIIENPILGPGFLNPKQPVKSFFFGDVNVIAAPIKYLKCILKLIEFCKAECNGIPWIINTMGYNKGFGLELIASITKILNPTSIIQIQSGRFSDNFENLITAEFVNRFKFNIFAKEIVDTEICDFRLIEITSVANKHEETGEWDMAPADLRLMNILSHLGGNREGLTETVPYE